MPQLNQIRERRTSADEVFDHLYQEIISLKLLPDTKMSEVEIASQFEVSRQPVREAFSRLGNLGLVLIRPQKATVVRKFSSREIAHARFVRTAIEVEVLRVACDLWPTANRTPVLENLDAQKTAVHAQEADRFHQLDYDFHRLLCRAAEAEFAFKTIAQMKTQVDRLCLLSLERPTEMEVLLADHTRMVEALEAQDFDALNATIRHHLARLDDVVAAVRESHTDYFED
ncbi:MAG: GntR family transcriptional regulator [Pseudomonadota bacterium]